MSLSQADVDQFLNKGFVKIPQAFDTAPGSIAHRWIEDFWTRRDLDPKAPHTWPANKVHMPSLENEPVRTFAPAAFEAMCDLMGGEENIHGEPHWGNGFIANFGWGRDKPWIKPSSENSGWHADGDWFQHFLDSPEQGLLCVVIFSDIQHRGGGTYIATDSVSVVSRFLAAHPEGVEPNAFGELHKQCKEFHEVTAKAGDVYLLHPFMLHASSRNHRPEARLMINPAVSFNEPMNFNRENPEDFSLVERGILKGLGVERLDFKITNPRQRLTPGRVANQKRLAEEEQARLNKAS